MSDLQSSSFPLGSLSFSALQSQARADAVFPPSTGPSSKSGYRIPASAISFGPRDRDRQIKSPKGFFLNKHQQAKRWLSGIGVGNGGPVFVRSLAVWNLHGEYRSKFDLFLLAVALARTYILVWVILRIPVQVLCHQATFSWFTPYAAESLFVAQKAILAKHFAQS
jgi:hypothetical protein